MAPYTLRQIKDAYFQKKEWEKQLPINYYVFRPLSFYLTCGVLRLTSNPAKVAGFGFLLGVMGCLLLIFSYRFSIWPGILLITLYSISDAVDGNVARTTRNVTLYGKYLDGLLGDLIEVSFVLALGIGLYLSSGPSDGSSMPILRNDHGQPLFLFLGSFIPLCRVWATVVRTQFETYRFQHEGAEKAEMSAVKAPILKSKFSDRWYYRVFINLESLNNQLFLLVLLSLLDGELWFFLFFALFYVCRSLTFTVFYFTRTKRTLLSK